MTKEELLELLRDNLRVKVECAAEGDDIKVKVKLLFRVSAYNYEEIDSDYDTIVK